MRKRSIFITLFLCLLASLLQAQNGFKNPILPGLYSDPSVCRAGDDYYLVTSSFSYFPGVPIFHSKDLVNWEQIGHVLTTKEQLPLDGNGAISGISAGIYAPTIRYHDGVFYMVTTLINQLKNFLVTATNPAGPWSAPIEIDLQGKFAIDPSLFFDDDGKVYLSAAPAWLAQIDVKTGKLMTPLKTMWSGTGSWSPEGPHLYKKDGWYYLLMAEGGTEYGHKVTIARSKKIEGPYTPNPANPILTHLGINTQNSPLQGVGHADFVQATDGSWWTVAHGFRPRSTHHILGRETLLAPVEWNKDGWPVINKDGTVAIDMNVPTLPLHPYPDMPSKDDFTTPTPGLQWNYIYNPVTSNYSLSEKPGFLRLKGSDATLSDEKKTVTFVGRRQQHEEFSASTLLHFTPTNQADEAGLTVFMDFKHHYDFSVKNVEGRRMLLLTYNVGMIKHVEKQIPLGDGPVELKVEGSVSAGYFSANYYTFHFRQGTGVFEEVAKAEAKYLSTETTGGFTGVYLGLFATGNGQSSTTHADFDWYEYQHK